MKYRAITIGREYGSGGGAIAESVAGHLGWRLLDRVMLREIAARAGVPETLAVAVDEHVDPWFYRVMRPVMGRGADGISMVLPVDVFDADSAADLASAVIEEAYHAGDCVIVGRGAQCVLRDRPDVLHVFVYAPPADRIRHIQGRIPEGREAHDFLREMDDRRLDYVRRHFGENRMDPHLYDLMINSHGETEPAVRIVLAAVQSARSATT